MEPYACEPLHSTKGFTLSQHMLRSRDMLFILLLGGVAYKVSFTPPSCYAPFSELARHEKVPSKLRTVLVHIAVGITRHYVRFMFIHSRECFNSSLACKGLFELTLSIQLFATVHYCESCDSNA